MHDKFNAIIHDCVSKNTQSTLLPESLPNANEDDDKSQFILNFNPYRARTTQCRQGIYKNNKISTLTASRQRIPITHTGMLTISTPLGLTWSNSLCIPQIMKNIFYINELVSIGNVSSFTNTLDYLMKYLRKEIVSKCVSIASWRSQQYCKTNAIKILNPKMPPSPQITIVVSNSSETVHWKYPDSPERSIPPTRPVKTTISNQRPTKPINMTTRLRRISNYNGDIFSTALINEDQHLRPHPLKQHFSPIKLLAHVWHLTLIHLPFPRLMAIATTRTIPGLNPAALRLMTSLLCSFCALGK